MILSCLHLGQNNGNAFNSVSRKICNRVLDPQNGHKTHCFLSSPSFMLSPILSVPGFDLGNQPGDMGIHQNILDSLASEKSPAQQ